MDKANGTLKVPAVAALAVTYRGDELLLVQRAKEPQKYGWGYPGGSVNPGESLHDAARRELFEETQIQGSPEQTFDVIEVNEFDPSGEHHHFILIAVLCRYESGDAIASDDAMDCQWMSMAQIMSGQTALIEHVGDVAKRAAKIITQRVKN
ncbi:NUDIX hydrolase [Pseudoalteromonas sp. SMS1]|uniref:NUDIX hydrolase n=1 Tax=Pseudoalteromonas sp. SMS1 TaxID=2908894 RepID=UPI001F210A6F|nr:NUDIX hydrolase [Pseudoalteromonas sp. SMS1]MCF2858487.1 NUDIX hydrolase [Pseudoalteromonas sp. SMS1]